MLDDVVMTLELVLRGIPDTTGRKLGKVVDGRSVSGDGTCGELCEFGDEFDDEDDVVDDEPDDELL